MKIYEVNVLFGIYSVDTKRILDLSANDPGLGWRRQSVSESSLSNNGNELGSSNLNLFVRPKSADVLLASATGNSINQRSSNMSLQDGDNGEVSFLNHARFHSFPASGIPDLDKKRFSAMLTGDRVSESYVMLTYVTIKICIAYYLIH